MSGHRSETAHERPRPGFDRDIALAERGEGHPPHRVVDQIARRASIPTSEAALESTQAILCAFGAWLDPGQRRSVADHLPVQLGQAILEPARSAVPDTGLVALYRCAALHHERATSLHEIALRCAAVLAVLGEMLPTSLVADLVDQLPEDIAALVPSPAPAGGRGPSPSHDAWLA